MRTIRIALVLTLVGAHTALAQEPATAKTPETLPARPTFQVTLQLPGIVVAPSPRSERVGHRARFRKAMRVMVRPTGADDVRSLSPGQSMSNDVATGAFVGAALALMTTANGCGPEFTECPMAKYLGIGAVAGAVIAAATHDQ
jgi:hypothetical protein